MKGFLDKKKKKKYVKIAKETGENPCTHVPRV